MFNFENEINQNEHVILEALLEPGDVLYIPPLWYHKVINLNTYTVAVNIWFYTQIHDKMDAMWSVSIPIENEWSMERKLVMMTT